MSAPKAVDQTVVRAAIHPAIGVARMGDSKSGFFVGPEVVAPSPHPPDFYRDGAGALEAAGRALPYLRLQCQR